LLTGNESVFASSAGAVVEALSDIEVFDGRLVEEAFRKLILGHDAGSVTNGATLKQRKKRLDRLKF
jgi:hypothetical protein